MAVRCFRLEKKTYSEKPQQRMRVSLSIQKSTNRTVCLSIKFKLYSELAIMPFSAAASVMIPALRGALLSRTTVAATTVAFRHMSAGPGFDYVKVNFRNFFLDSRHTTV